MLQTVSLYSQLFLTHDYHAVSLNVLYLTGFLQPIDSSQVMQESITAGYLTGAHSQLQTLHGQDKVPAVLLVLGPLNVKQSFYM